MNEVKRQLGIANIVQIANEITQNEEREKRTKQKAYQ